MSSAPYRLVADNLPAQIRLPSSAVDGYFRLALAVIAKAVDDVQHGTAAQRARARAEIEHGGLDRWIDAVSVERGSHGRMKELLREVVESG